MEADTVTITKNQLLDDSLFLEAGGVDNWDWYDDACTLYEEWKKE